MFRYEIENLSKIRTKFSSLVDSRVELLVNCSIHFLEPIGSVSPKVNTGDDLKSVKAETNKSLNLLCPAQAFPTPVFRSVDFLIAVFVKNFIRFENQ